MVNEVSCCLLGRTTSKKPSPEDALVWAEAAAFLAGRIQGTPSECPGRNPDMSSAAATALRTMLAQMEAAHTLMNNRERVVQDITNGGPNNIDGKALTQKDLKRVDAQHRACVDAMVREVCCRLLGKKASMPQVPGELSVWAEAARFLSGRVQGAPADCPGRSPDMSSAAATALRTMLAQIEAAHMLMSNRARVVQDITNPGPNNIDGKELTQKDLKRVGAQHRACVDAMVSEVCCRLLGKGASMPQVPGEVSVWAEAARFLSGRVQGAPADCPGRSPDMSPAAAAALRAVLELVEAGK
jgi:hypothetical protein